MNNTIKASRLLQLPEEFNKNEIHELLTLAYQGGQSYNVSLVTLEKIEKANTIVIKFHDGYYVLKSRNINNIENIKFREYETFSQVPVDLVGINYILTARESSMFTRYLAFHKAHLA